VNLKYHAKTVTGEKSDLLSQKYP